MLFLGNFDGIRRKERSKFTEGMNRALLDRWEKIIHSLLVLVTGIAYFEII